MKNPKKICSMISRCHIIRLPLNLNITRCESRIRIMVRIYKLGTTRRTPWQLFDSYLWFCYRKWSFYNKNHDVHLEISYKSSSYNTYLEISYQPQLNNADYFVLVILMDPRMMNLKNRFVRLSQNDCFDHWKHQFLIYN